MTDLTTTIAPKSDQLNADDLIGKTKTIKVTRVSTMAEPEQPVAINFEGDNGKPYKPCKSMRRVLVTVWGGDGNAYVGRSMTLYRDDDVRFGGLAVGGIRISHMSDITKDTTLALTATRTVRKPYTVKPLASVAAPSSTLDAEALLEAAQAAAREGRVPFGIHWKALGRAERDALKPHLQALQAICDADDSPFMPAMGDASTQQAAQGGGT